MAEIDTRFRIFLKAFLGDTLARMCGPLSVISAAIGLWIPGATPKTVFAGLAAVSGIYAAYRVWRNERLAAAQRLSDLRAEAANQIAGREEQIATIRQQLDAYRSVVEVSVKVSGTPPSQVIAVVSSPSHKIMISHMEYMTSDETAVVAEDVSLEGTALKVPLNYPMIQQVWNAYRPDRNGYDHSGPAKIGLVISIGDKKRHFILPVAMNAHFINSTNYIHIVGSKTFIG